MSRFKSMNCGASEYPYRRRIARAPNLTQTKTDGENAVITIPNSFQGLQVATDENSTTTSKEKKRT